MVGLTVILIAAIINLRKRFSMLEFAIVVIIGTLWAWPWQYFMTHYDRKYPGWWYDPETVVGYLLSVSIEDWYFYSVCGGLFFFVRLIFISLTNKFNLTIKNNFEINRIILGVSLLLSTAAWFLCAPGGKSILLWFMLPSIAMWIMTIDKIKTISFLFTMTFVVGFAAVWDLCFQQWHYITEFGQHSNLWSSNKNMWVGDIPVDILPIFGIAGGFFCYTLPESVSSGIKFIREMRNHE